MDRREEYLVEQRNKQRAQKKERENERDRQMKD